MFGAKKEVKEIKKIELPKYPREDYRVGITIDGQTTLTFLNENGMSMTLYMNRESCDLLIRMLQSTYDLEEAK